MCIHTLKTYIVRLAIAVVLGSSSNIAQAQLNSLPEFFETHFRVETTDSEDGPKLRTAFDYTAFGTLITRSEVKMNNGGFEDHMALGMVQNVGSMKAGVTYNLHRFNYVDREDQADDVTMDFHYRFLHVQQHFADTEQVLTIGLPFDINISNYDISFSQTQQKDSSDTIEVYKIVSQAKRLKLSATWKDTGNDTWVDFSSEYRPSDSWLMMYAYTDDGDGVQRKLRSEFVTRGYRLAGEFTSQSEAGEESYITGTIGIEKGTDLAAFKLHLEYDGDSDSRSVLFNIESDVIF